jgi:hypothetical protein
MASAVSAYVSAQDGSRAGSDAPSDLVDAHVADGPREAGRLDSLSGRSAGIEDIGPRSSVIRCATV